MLNNAYKNDGVPSLKLNSLQLAVKRQIEQKIRDQIYTFETVNCAVCDGSDFELLAEKDRFGLYAPVVICRTCGLLQINPRMIQDSYNQFYKSEYRELYRGKNTCNEDFFEKQKVQGKHIYDYLSTLLPELKTKTLSILEVGCGAGGILSYFKEKGHHVKGLDLGTQYLEYGREHHDLCLSFGTIDDYVDSKKPDLIIYSHVLEHVLDVDKELQKVRELIDPDGLIYIEVPSIKNLIEPYNADFMQYLQNAHVYHFSLTTLKNLLAKNGFQLVQGNERVQSLFKISKTTTPQPVNDYVAAMKYLRKAEWFVKLKISLAMRLVLPCIRKIMARLKLTSWLRSQYTKCITKK